MIRGTQQRSRTNKSDVSSDLNLSTSTDGGCSTVADISRNDSVPGPSHVKLDPAALLYLDSLDSGSETDDARPGWNPKCTDSKAAGSEGLKSIHSWLERESDEEDSDAAAAADDDDDDHHRHHHHHHPANDPTSGATPLTKHRGGTGCISVSSLMLATQVLHRQPLSLERRDRRAVSASPRASRGAQAGKQTGKGPCNIWSPASQEASLSGTPKTAVGHWGGRGRRRSISLTNLDDLRTQEMPPPRSLYPELATQIVSPAGSPTKELDGSCSRGRLLELEPLDASSRDTTIPEAMRLWLDEEDAFPGEPRVEDDEQQGAFMDEQKNLMSSFSRSECLSDAESSSCATKEALNLASNARMLSWLSRSEEGEQDAALDDEQQSEIASLKTSREQAAISPGSNMSAFPNLPGGRPKSFFDGPSTDSLALDRFLEDEGGTFLSPDAEDTREEDEEGKLVGESFSSRSRSFFDSLDRSHLDGERFTGSIKCESMRSWMMEADMEESADMEMLRIAPPAPCDHAPVPPATNRWGGDKDQEHLAETAGMMLPLPPPLTIPSMSPPPAVPHVEMPAPALGKYPALIMDTDLGGSSKQPLIRGRVTPKNGSPRGKVSPASPHSVSSRQQQEHPARSPLTLMETTESSSSDDYEDEARDIFDSPTDEEECPGGSSHGGHDSEGGIDAAILELGPDDQDYIYLTQNLDLHEVLLRTGDLHFGEVDVRRQAYLMRQLVPMRFYRGDVIIQQGDVADSFYIIVGAPRELLTPDEEDGSVVVSVEGPTGGSRDICRLHSGECFGERALVSSMLGKRSASIKAASAIVDVVRVDQMHFNDWVDFRSYLLMKEVPLLAKLPGRSLVALQRTLHWVDFSPRSYIVRQGEEGDAFYMITKGSVEVIEEGADGQQSILVQMYEGQFFGELALIYNEPRNASVRAITNVSCMYLSKENFRGCLNDESFKEVLEEVAYQRELYRERRKKIRAKKGKATVRRIGSNQIVAGGSWADSTHAVIQTPNLVKTRLENGARIINKYEVRSELGRGAYGTVFLCRHVDTHHEYAMKVIDKGRKQLGVGSRAANLRREVAAMKKLRHPNIVTLWEVIDDPKSQHLYMVQEYVECGSVLPEGCPVPPLPASDARPHFIDCLRGLHYLHTHNVIHGDIKPANLIKSSLGVVKIADFGAAVMLSETEDEDGPGGEQGRATQRLVGTPAFMAPELFGEDGISNMSPGSDVWAMGVTLFQMVCGTLPFWFKGCTQMELENIVKYKDVEIPVSQQHASGNMASMWGSLQNLIRRMLDKNAATRITLDECIEHPWVTVEGSVPQDPLGSEGYAAVEPTQGEMQNAWLMVPTSPCLDSPAVPPLTHTPSQGTTRRQRALSNLSAEGPSTPSRPPSFFSEDPSREPPSAAANGGFRGYSSLAARSGSWKSGWGRIPTPLTPSIVGNLGPGFVGDVFGVRGASPPISSAASDSPVDFLTSSAQTPPSFRTLVDETPRTGSGLRRGPPSPLDIAALSLPSPGANDSSGVPTRLHYRSMSVRRDTDGGSLMWRSANRVDAMMRPNSARFQSLKNDRSSRFGGLGGSYHTQSLSSDTIEKLKEAKSTHPFASSVSRATEVTLEISSPTSLNGYASSLAEEAVSCSSGGNSTVSLESISTAAAVGAKIGTEESDNRPRDPLCRNASTGIIPDGPPSDIKGYLSKFKHFSCSDGSLGSGVTGAYADERSRIKSLSRKNDFLLLPTAIVPDRSGKMAKKAIMFQSSNASSFSPLRTWVNQAGSLSSHRSSSRASSGASAGASPMNRRSLVHDISPAHRRSVENLWSPPLWGVKSCPSNESPAASGTSSNNSPVSPLMYDENDCDALSANSIASIPSPIAGLKLNSIAEGAWTPERVVNVCSTPSPRDSIGSDSDCSEDSDDWDHIVSINPDDIDVIIPTTEALLDPTTLPLSEEEFPGLDVCVPPQSRTWVHQENMELGIRFGRGVDQGTRQSMEDRTIAVADLFSGPAKVPGDHTPPPYSSKAKSPPLCGDDDEPRAAAFFGVYDGHNGVEVADILQKGLHKSLASQVCFPKDIPAALEAACKEIDEQCIELDSKRMQALIQEGTYCCGEESEESTACHLTRGGGAMSFSGAAAAMVVIYRSEEDTAGHVVLYAANVGDCRVVLCRRGEAIDLTMDHTPKREDEARRIVAAGGFVSRQRLNGILGISRAFGDIAYKAKHPGPGGLEGDIWDNQLISRPEITRILVQPEDSFVIIATDGVWDVMSSIEAVSFVHRRLLFHHDIQRVSRELTLKAIELASGDNCSCTIIGLNQVERVSGGRSCDATAPPPPPPPFNDSACFGEMGGINTHSD